jgi:sulfate adenylyltransferase subunit 1 (EFTu-like GTPase family)
MVVRPDDVFRGYAGQIVSGTVKPGDRITAWPSGRSARVKRIVTFDGDLDMAFAPMSVTLTLDDEIDISRGDVLTHFDSAHASTPLGVTLSQSKGQWAPSDSRGAKEPALVGQKFEAEVVWMDERPLDPARVYLLKHSTRTVTAEVNHALVLNQIGTVQVSTARPLVFDRYAQNRGTGSFILIDPSTQFTCGAGMITDPLRDSAEAHHAAPLSFAERLAHIARRAASDEEAADLVRKALEEMLT